MRKLVLRAINHKLRQRIVDLLEENQSMTVTDIYIKLRLERLLIGMASLFIIL